MEVPRTQTPTTGPVLVTGAAGFVGSALAWRLARAGRRVVGATRGPVQLPEGVEPLILGDLTQVCDWHKRLSGFDSIVHCAARAHILRDFTHNEADRFMAVNARVPAEMARGAAAAGVRRFVFLSSIGVLGSRTEGCAFRHDDVPAPHSPYAVAKLAGERDLAEVSRETGIELVVVRPPLVIGRNPPGNLGTLVRAMRRGWPLPFAGATRNRRDLVRVETLVDILLAAINRREAAGEVLLAADGRPLSTREIIETLGQYEGIRPRLIPFPAFILTAVLRMAGKGAMAEQLFGDLEVDIAHTRRVLEWEPPADHSGMGGR